MDAGQRQHLRAAIGRNGDRLAGLEERFTRLEAFVFANAGPAERLDGVAAEVEELRHRLQLVEQRVGLATRKPRGAHRRRLAVIALRERGHSLRAISVLLGLARHTVESDLRGANVTVPPEALGVDGKTIGRRRQNGRTPA
jgi:lambda repressor-like predicted transcriptional regulator